MATIGTDTDGQRVELGDIERRSGLYVLGKPGMGKTTLLVNLMYEDIQNGHGLFFLDPHGDAVDEIALKSPRPVTVFDLKDETHTFGINLLACRTDSLTEQMDVYTRAYSVFRRLWSDNWGVWFQNIIENTLLAFIENQDYTLAEVPLFLTDRQFRFHVLATVTGHPGVLDFWKYEYRPEHAEPVLTRLRPLLNHPYVRHIVGQTETTLDFPSILSERKVALFKLAGALPDDVKRFIGTILISELTHAIMSRKGIRHHFSVFVDEFQNFATDDFSRLILEARKFGCAVTIAHQERYGQFGENRKILGATDACANKVLFQLTGRDAKELAAEFADKPTASETRLVPELVICKEPIWDLLRRGHSNPRIMELFRKYLLGDFEKLIELKNKAESLQLTRSGFSDAATLFRDQASLSGIDEKWESINTSAVRGRNIAVSRTALDRTESSLQQMMKLHGLAAKTMGEIETLLENIQDGRRWLRRMEEVLVAVMEGQVRTVAGDERFANYIYRMAHGYWSPYDPPAVRELFTFVRYGDPKQPRTVVCAPDAFKMKYFPKQTEACYIGWQRTNYEAGNYTEEKIREALEQARIDLYRGYRVSVLTGRYPVHLPEVPLGVLDDRERERIEQLCYEEILSSLPEFFTRLDEAIEFCRLFTQPENHIKEASGVYVEKPVNIRSVSDMINEMAQTLTNLPKYSAYIKIIEENEGTQAVRKGKVTTPWPLYAGFTSFLNATRASCLKERTTIEREIRERRNWKSGRSPDAPPPAWE